MSTLLADASPDTEQIEVEDPVDGSAPQRQGITAYERFAAKSRPRRGGSGSRSIDTINDAPFLLADLPDFFLGLKPERLAAAWVACFVDACWMGDFEPGDVARALIVVADRLHGVKVEIIQGEPVVMPTAAPIVPSIGKPPAPAAPAPSSKYAVYTGPAPEAKRKNARVNEAYAFAMNLQPGAWFIYEDAPKTFNCKVNSEKWSKAAGFTLLLYRSSAGKVIVRRPEGAPGRTAT